jgi:hypothetical protein
MTCKSEQTGKPAAYMLANREAQHGSRCRESEFELGHIMADLPLLHEFEFLEVLSIQAA